MHKKKVMGEKTEEILFNFICKTPGLSTYELEKKLQWTGGRVRIALQRLEKKNLIRHEYEFSHRTRKRIFPKIQGEFEAEVKKVVVVRV